MNETLNRYRELFQKFWGQFSNKQRILFIGTFVLSVATISILVFQFSKTEYSQAFTSLNPTDAANVKAYLEDNGIPYKLSLDGQTIGVPSTMVSSVKIDVTSQGLVANGAIGYEIFRENMNSWSMTDSQFDVINADARAGEVQRLINSINGVSSSEVLITMPKQSVFINADRGGQEASASVVVMFRPGYPPDQKKIDTIYNIVAKSVPSLSLDNITISDQNGELLPSSKLGAGLGAANQIEQQLRVKKQFEIDLQRSVMSFLAPLIGQDDVIVSVFSTLNFDQKTSDQNLVTPVNEESGSGIVISRESNEESESSENADPGGVVGTGTTDIPGFPATSGTTGSSESEKNSLVENFEINRIRNQIISSPYVVQDLSISVGLNLDPNDPNSLDTNTVEQVESLLRSVVASSLANNGQSLTDELLATKVSVIARNFAEVDVNTNASNQTLLYSIIGGLVVVLLVGAVLFMVRRRKASEQAANDGVEMVPQSVSEAFEMEQLGEFGKIRIQIEQLAKQKPEDFANLLRVWMAEE